MRGHNIRMDARNCHGISSVMQAFAQENMKQNQVTILLSQHERDLILEHGYPFDEIEAQLRKSTDADLTRVTDDPFWWERVIVNLHISENEPEKLDVSSELRKVINRIASELKLNKKI
jgi:hypothetical protein